MRVALCYSKAGSPKYGLGHIGMGNTCRQNAYSLRNHGIHAEVWPVAGGDAIEARLLEENTTLSLNPVTHVVIGAPYIPIEWMRRLSQRFPKVIFAVVSHSNVGFLQAESAAIRLMRGSSDLAIEEFNFHCAANSHRLVEDFQAAYGRAITHLPNMYDLSATKPPTPRIYHGGVVRIGSFGALRVQKNFTCAAWAAMAIARHLRAPLEFWINTGRDDNNGKVVYNAIRAATDNVPGVELKELAWTAPIDFRKVAHTMHLLIQPSYSETFSMVTADAVVEGTPVVVSEAIDWVPDYWVAEVDSVQDIADVGCRLISNGHAAHDGYQSLQKHNASALRTWMEFLQCR